MNAESRAMRFFRRLGMDGLSWSCRRLHCPVKKDDLVLEVGSGGNPYFRSNILCDAYLETRERHFVPLVNDRPTILAFTEHLPFQDDSFDFCIASHVLEHSKDPEVFIQEVQRVSRAGYIEVPDALLERLSGYVDHRLEITERSGELIIRKKKGSTQDLELSELLFNRASKLFGPLVSKHPFHFHVRHYWAKSDGGIRYRILNPEYVFDWDCPVRQTTKPGKSFKAKVHQTGLWLARKLLSQTARNNRIDIVKYLRCVVCKGVAFSRKGGFLKCDGCGREISILSNGIIDFTK